MSSRRNGLKHGLTGKGIVISELDLAEVDRRNEALQEELAPQSMMGAILVQQMATLSVRMERGARQEFASVATRVRHASDEFDAARVEHAEQLLKGIGDDPRGNLRQLLKSPEGVDVLVGAWHELRDKLTCEARPIWGMETGARMAHLLGFRVEEPRAARIGALTKATWADFGSLAECDGGGLEREARRGWARARLLERIDEEIAGLEAHFLTLDFETIDLDRAEAGDRALFDPSKQANLARRYEAEARRGFFKALKEFRQVEAEALERSDSEPTPASTSSAETSDLLASCCEMASPDPDDPDEAPVERTPETFWPVSQGSLNEDEVVQGADGARLTPRRAIPVLA